MDDLITKIIDIEAQAQEIIKGAKTADEHLEADIEAETSKLHKDIANKAEAKTVTIKQLENSEAQKQIAKIREKTMADIEKLNEKYEANKGAWVDKIVSNIIG